jgi:DNA mismatch repair ATPase MutL
MMIVEIVLSGKFFAKGDEMGFMGGVLQASFFSFIFFCIAKGITFLYKKTFVKKYQKNSIKYCNFKCSPMFVLNIIIDTHDVDVNVTPDKLQMFIKSENLLLAIVKASLQKQFSRLLENISLNESSFHCQNSTMLEFFTSSKTPNNKNTSKIISKSDDIEVSIIEKNSIKFHEFLVENEENFK